MTSTFRMFCRTLTSFTGLALLAAICAWPAAAQQALQSPQPFAKGDTVCFVGDSITHGGKYQAFVYLFYATRFPDRELKMYNCGISGDSAGGACRRLEWDILVHKPTAATVLLGMNDVGRTLYGKDKTDPKCRTSQEAAIKAYAGNMTKLAEGLQRAGVKVTYLTPTIYEQNADTGTENLFGCNEGLQQCGREAVRIAQQFASPTVDVHAAMNAINNRLQKDDPKFTLVGRDRVHPGDVGHFVIAYTLLKAQRLPAYVSKIAIAADGHAVVEQGNCTVSNLQASPTAVAFDCLARALPYPVAKPAADALRLVPFQAELNQEVLKIDGLAPGEYELRIDEQVVGRYDAPSLKAGVNLAGNPQTPQYQQAEKVAELNSKRHALESGRLRTFAAVQHGFLAQSKVDPQDIAAIKVLLDQRLEKLKGGPYYEYNKSMVNNYLKNKPNEKATIAEIEQAMAEMYRANQPQKHRYVISRK
jgi:lysophospholipase L1-like esterase